MTDDNAAHDGMPASGSAPGEPDAVPGGPVGSGAYEAEPVTAADEALFGLWASGNARYQQAGYAEPIGHARLAQTGGGPALPQGSWRAGPYRSSNARALVAIALVVIAVGARALIVGTDLLLMRVVGGAGVDDPLAALAVALSQTVPTLATGAFFVSGIAVVAWLSRLVDNAPSLTGWTPRRSPREAIGWWFVPIASWVVPYEIVRDTVTGLDPEQRPRSGLLPAWWGLYLIGLVGGALVGTLAATMVSTSEILVALGLEAAVNATMVVAGILLVLVIRRAERFSAIRANEVAVRPVLYYGGPSRAELEAAAAPAHPAVVDAREHVIVAATADGPAAPPPPPA